MLLSWCLSCSKSYDRLTATKEAPRYNHWLLGGSFGNGVLIDPGAASISNSKGHMEMSVMQIDRATDDMCLRGTISLLLTSSPNAVEDFGDFGW